MKARHLLFVIHSRGDATMSVLPGRHLVIRLIDHEIVVRTAKDAFIWRSSVSSMFERIGKCYIKLIQDTVSEASACGATPDV